MSDDNYAYEYEGNSDANLDRVFGEGVEVLWNGEGVTEHPKHVDRNAAGLFECLDVNRDVLGAVDSTVKHGEPTDLREAAVRAEQMRRLFQASLEMQQALEAMIREFGCRDPDCATCGQARDALPDLDVDADVLFPWLMGEQFREWSL
jgi:hypothetical protein